MADAGTLSLIEVKTGNRTPTSGDQHDVRFPEDVQWGDVLDARHTPYTEKTVPELLHYAAHVHKKYILVRQAG